MAIRMCCITGHLANGTPSGSEDVFGGINCYVARPPAADRNPTEAVVIASDMFGYKLPNTRLLADELALNGFLVVVPDVLGAGAFDVDKLRVTDTLLALPKPGMWNKLVNIFWKIVALLMLLPMLLRSHNRRRWRENIPKFEAVIKDLRNSHGIRKLAFAGYCYGVPFATHFAKKDSDLADVFIAAHGDIAVPGDILPLTRPGLFICADNDRAFPAAARQQAESLLKPRTPETDYEFRFYPGCVHGFAVRGNHDDPVVREAVNDATAATVNFIRRNFAKIMA